MPRFSQTSRFRTFRQPRELSHIRIPPAINRLFAITHHQVVPAAGQRIVKQGKYVQPLQPARILKFINQVMMIMLAKPFINKRYRLSLNDIVDLAVEVTDKNESLLILYFLADARKLPHEQDGIHLPRKQQAELIPGIIIRDEFTEITRFFTEENDQLLPCH